MKKYYLLLSTLFLIFQSNFAQTHSFTIYDPPAGNLVNDLDVDENNQLLVATDQGMLIFDGTNWTTYTSNDGLPDNDVKSIAVSENTVYISTANKGLATFSNNNWKIQSIATTASYSYINSIFIRPDGNLVYGTDEGDVMELSPGQTNVSLKNYAAVGANLGKINDVHETTTGILIAYSANGLVLDASATFIGVTVPITTSAGLPSNNVLSAAMSNDISYDGTDAGLNVADFNVPTILPPNLELITVSTPNSQLPSNRIQALAVDQNDVLWLGTDQGLVKKDDDDWTVYDQSNSNISSNDILEIAIDANDKVWIATADGKISTFGNPIGIAKNNDPAAFTLGNNYPNPFNHRSVINYSVRQKQQLKLTIYDVLGKEVTTLVDEVKEPGNYQASIEATALNTGIYFYVLTTSNGNRLTKKMHIVE